MNSFHTFYEDYRLLTESKTDIVGLGYTLEVANFFQKQFGKNAFLFARWFKEAHNYRRTKENWFNELSFHDDMVQAYRMAEGIRVGGEVWDKVAYYYDLTEKYDEDDYDELVKQAYEEFKDMIFFRKPLIADITSGKLVDISQFKKLTFQQAENAYDQKRIFRDAAPVLKYDDGSRWIDVGNRCNLIGDQMKNCGSAGVMSTDREKTMLVMFDKTNNPRLVATYSPNEKRLSGIQRKASVKVIENKFVPKIISLAEELKATYDMDRGGSEQTNVITAWLFRNKKHETTPLKTSTFGNQIEVYLVDVKGQQYAVHGHYGVIDLTAMDNQEEIKSSEAYQEYVEGQDESVFYTYIFNIGRRLWKIPVISFTQMDKTLNG